MPRKKQTSITEITPALLKFREKRKWQINYRRYVVEQSPCPYYAPYFGLDINNLRKWFEYQFNNDLNWGNFGKSWQFAHIIPVTYFDFSNEEDLKMCWNFINIRVEKIQLNRERGNRLDVLNAKNYFKELFEKTQFPICSKLLLKIDEIEVSDFVSTEAQQQFIKEHSQYLDLIKEYSTFEFELLNSGRSIDEVKKEVDFYKNIGRQSQ